MPRQALYSVEFGAKIGELIGDLSLEQAGIRTGLAGETIRRMRAGKIPEPDTLRMFAEGFADRGADLQVLRIAAGYESPSGVVAAVEAALPPVTDISEEEKQLVLDVCGIMRGGAESDAAKKGLAVFIKELQEKQKTRDKEAGK